MAITAASERIERVLQATAPFMGFFKGSTWMKRREETGISDFVVGNPHEMPLPGFVRALGRSHVPRNKDWFAYKMSEEEPRRVVAASLSRRRGGAFEPEDVFLTNGGFAALSVCLSALANPGEEVLFVSPPWFFYEAIITSCGAVPIRVRCDPDTFDLDLQAISSALSERTRAVIVNSPNNPTGRIYPPETLSQVAEILEEAGRRSGRTIYVLSDEAYSRIIYEGRPFPSPADFYPNTFILYTYGKTLLTPGERLGYIALPPTMPDREVWRQALPASQFVTGYAFPNAVLQHALPNLEELCIDVAHLQRKRDRLYEALKGMGYRLHLPEGTFYLLVQSPVKDDLAFAEMLARSGIFVLPGSIVELPGTFRLSLTATDAMIDRSLSGFEAVLKEAESRPASVSGQQVEPNGEGPAAHVEGDVGAG